MKNWKVTIEYETKVSEVIIKAKCYSHAYVKAAGAYAKVGLKYPGCIVKSISEIKN